MGQKRKQNSLSKKSKLRKLNCTDPEEQEQKNEVSKVLTDMPVLSAVSEYITQLKS